MKELIAQRVKLTEDARGVWNKADKEKRGLTTEERETVKKLNSEIDEVRNKIEAGAAAAEEDRTLRASLETEERHLSESRGRQTGGPSPTPGGSVTASDRNLALRAWALGKHASPAMKAAAERCGVQADNPIIDVAIRTSWGPDGKEVREFIPFVPTMGSGDIDVRAMADVEARNMSIGTTTAGGNLVPNEMIRKYADVQKWYGRLAAAAQQVMTETGATLPWPAVDDTSNSGEVKTEGTSANAADPTVNVINLGAFTFSSKRVHVSWELLQDSFVDISTLLGTLMGRRIARFKNTKFTSGAGTTEPKGLITGANVGKTAASAILFTADEVIDLIHSVDKAYRGLPDTGFMIHDTIIAFIRKMKDGQGRYLWEPALQAGQPDRFYGYQIEVNNDMDSALTTGKKLVGFGNIPTAFVVRQAGATRFIRDESILVQQHQTYFEAYERGDSNVVDATAFKVLALG